MKTMRFYRITLVIFTSLFIAFHTQVFINSIEPNYLLSWLAAILVEGLLISLALMSSIPSRILLVVLFIVSTLSASASFVVKNDDLLEQFFKNKMLIENLNKDIQQTSKELASLNMRYTTKSLQRERQLKDQLLKIISNHDGRLALSKSMVFFTLIFTLQLVSVYTAASLKNGVKIGKEHFSHDFYYGKNVKKVKVSNKEEQNGKLIDKLNKLKAGKSLDELTEELNISKPTLMKVLNDKPVSKATLEKIAGRLEEIF